MTNPKPNIESRKVRKIKFWDSCINDAQTKDILTPQAIEAIGFVIKETKEYITITREIFEDGRYCGQLSIPKGAII